MFYIYYIQLYSKNPDFRKNQNDFLACKMSTSMKRLEVIVPSSKLNLVVAAIEDIGVGGVTIIDSKGRGKGQRPTLRSMRGTQKKKAEYNNISTIITVVNDSKVNHLIDAILAAASTGSNGDGKIFVSSVDETIDIQTKLRGGAP
jgi:nitrogen regulatory protein P-II 1